MIKLLTLLIEDVPSAFEDASGCKSPTKPLGVPKRCRRFACAEFCFCNRSAMTAYAPFDKLFGFNFPDAAD